MTITITIPGYLILRGRTYHFRRMVPHAIRNQLGTREIKVSLQTSDLCLAAMRARVLYLESEKVFAMGKKKTFTDRFRERFEERMFEGMMIDPPKMDWSSLKKPATKRVPADKSKAAVKPASPLFSSVIADFLKDKKRSGTWSEASARKEGAKLVLALDMVGDKPVNAITKKDAIGLKDLLLSLPPKAIQNGKPVAKFKGMSWQEIAAQKHDQTMSPKTWSHYQKILSSFFGWAIQHDLVSDNPFDGLKIKGAKSRQRVPFTNDQAQTVLAALLQEPGWFSWIVLIGMYSGARLTEICQLYRDDILERDGVLCFRITDEKPDQTVKADASKRLVPVHSKLLELGFKDWIADKNERLFDNLTMTKATGYNSQPSKHFAKFKDKLGLVPSDPERYRLDFHSWRHSVSSRLMDAGVPEQYVAAILGHAQGKTMSFSVYGHGVSAVKLKEAVEQIRYE